MNQQELGAKLKKARELAGMSQQDAANALSVPRTAVTQMEAGNRSVSTLELTKLAALYRQLVTHFFEESEGDNEDALVTLYRIDPGLDRDQKVKDQVRKYVHWCREGHNLEQLLGRGHRSGPPIYAEAVPGNIGEAVEQGERTAEEERKRLGIGAAPIPDMSELINEQGIWASGADFPDHMSGLFLKDHSFGMAIFVNADHARARKRFSYAHEYAHALLDRNVKAAVSNKDNAAELGEKRANAFAAAFLMPREGVTILLNNLDKGKPSRAEKTIFDVATEGKIDVGIRPAPNSQHITYQDIAIIAHHFGVSYQAATYRLKSLSHISQKECETLLGQANNGRKYLEILDMSDDLEKPEARKLWKRELRSHIVRLAMEAYRREEISRGKLLELGKITDIAPDDLINLAEATRAYQ